MTNMNSIKHPSHYVEGRKFEPWDVILDWDLPYLLGNCVKYIARCGRKVNNSMLQDLYKCREYLDKQISVIEETAKGTPALNLTPPKVTNNDN